MDKDIKEVVKSSNLTTIEKKDLNKCKSRSELILSLSKILFTKRVENNKVKFDEHNKLNYFNDDTSFKKDAINIIKKI